MSTFISYDVSNEKQNEFKNRLKKTNPNYVDFDNQQEIPLPETSMLRPHDDRRTSTQNVNDTVEEMILAAIQVQTTIESAIVVSTNGPVSIFAYPSSKYPKR